MSPFEQLGLPPDADERTIKRAYAQRLREVRTDRDPEGFQRLHATYQAALALCQRRTTVAVAKPVPLRQPLPATPPAQPPATAPSAAEAPTAVPFERFLAELLGLAAQGEAAALQSWLQAQPALWSLRTKARVGHELFVCLYRDAPPMPPACLDALLAFFDMNHARSGHDPLALQRLQRRMQLAWERLPQQRDALAARLGMRDRKQRRTLERRLARLSQPFRWSRAIALGLVPNAADRLAQFIRQLALHHPEDLPAGYDRRQLRFWLEATDRLRVGRARLQLGGLRCLAALLGGLLLGLLAGVLLRLPPQRFVFGALETCLGLAAVPCVLWTLWMGLLPLDHWHARAEHLPARWPWLNLLLVPLLCAVALVLHAASGLRWLAIAPALVALWLALRRLWRRNALSSRINPRLLWAGVWIAAVLLINLLQASGRSGGSFDYAMLAAAMAMPLWAIDLWRQRRLLRVRGNVPT